MDHDDLIAELTSIEKLSNQERLRLAHRRRALQLKKWTQYEKEMNSKKNRAAHQEKLARNARAPRIKFLSSIMLLEAAGRNDVDEVRRLLEGGVDPDVANEDGLTALHQCCIDDNEEMMRLLIDYGANVNAEDSEKWTPLHASSTCGHLHLVKYLIQKGAKLLAVNAEGNMPYDICDDELTLDYIESEMAKRGVTQELIEEIRALPETKMLEDIQKRGGDLEYRDQEGATPLHIAAANGYYRVAEFLLDNHVSTDVLDKDKWQPIHAAACWGHIEVLELLVQNGADLNARTKNGETPYMICEDPDLKGRIVQLRNEQEVKSQEARLKATPTARRASTNSRTQSIRRTSNREKGLSSKKDVQGEAQMLVSRDQNGNESSPSPTNGDPSTASSNSPSPANSNSAAESNSDDSSEEIRPPPLARSSVANIHKNSNPGDITRLETIAKKSRAPEPPNSNSNLNDQQHKMNNINLEDLTKTNPIAVNNINNNNNLRKMSNNSIGSVKINNLNNLTEKNGGLTPLDKPPNNYKVIDGNGNLSRSGSCETLDNNRGKIDIHVQVTISSAGNLNSGLPAHFLASQPGTLSELKKQRSLQYNTTRGTTLNSLNLFNGSSDLQKNSGYNSTASHFAGGDMSPSLSLRKFAGDAGEIVGEPENLSKCTYCCTIV